AGTLPAAEARPRPTVERRAGGRDGVVNIRVARPGHGGHHRAVRRIDDVVACSVRRLAPLAADEEPARFERCRALLPGCFGNGHARTSFISSLRNYGWPTLLHAGERPSGCLIISRRPGFHNEISSMGAYAAERNAAGVQCLAQLPRLGRCEVGDHLPLDRLNGLAQ